MALEWLFVISLTLAPIYAFASGGLQIAHIVMGLYCLGRLVSVRPAFGAPETALSFLCVVIIIREWTATNFGYGSGSGLMEFLYVAFGLLILLCVRTSDLNRLAGAAAWGVWGGAIVALVGVAATDGLSIRGVSIDRAIGTFNNPNQLAYFALLNSCLAMVLWLSGHMRTLTTIVLHVMMAILSMVALSKAGLIAQMAVSAIFLWYIVSKYSSNHWGTIVVLLSGAGVVLAVAAGFFDQFLFVQRLASTGSEADDGFLSRGYAVWLDGSWTSFLFGLGQEGVLLKFGHEVHSTFASFFGKYGAIGGTLFLSFVGGWFHRTKSNFGWTGIGLTFLPVALYGLTHNGSRFMLFWVLVALVGSLKAAHGSVRCYPLRVGQRSLAHNRIGDGALPGGGGGGSLGHERLL
ncbi:hypothetical protein [Sphingomonas xanthus]|uniref:Uncharacterized protein n=1 Tax=Sphingomonas xanthus TaxID=2594473 RepID=A0A516IU85_9SPHN|nr:hypothetical protein [Sphingomonas xanthus]QDP20441.1 hypothetical protein FMM02_11035 [Sphingomonas xanthus]